MGTWGDIIAAADSKRFIGREIELLRFKEHLTVTPPEYLIHYIYGQGGVGKTTLLKEFQKSAMHEGWTVASCDERHQDVPKLLAHWADQLHQKGYTFHHFTPIYRTYQQRLTEIEQDPDAPQGFMEGFGRFLARETLRIGEHVPIIGEGVRLLPSESLEKHAGAWLGYIAKKITNKDEVAILRDPIGTLAPLFFKDLNNNAQETPTLLCIDTFEALPPHIESWLGQLAMYEPHQSIRLIIAGRTTPSHAWEPLRHLMWVVGLDVFTEEEAAIYLDQHGILDVDQRTEIVQLSGRLPVVMSLLAATDPKQASRSTTPITDTIERFLRWIDDPTQRTAALLASTSKVFNIDILNVLLARDDQTFHPQAIFTWLCTMPFVQESDQGWHYHPVVRRLMLRYQRQTSMQGYRQAHTKLADWYNQQRSTIRRQPWVNDAWQQTTLHYVYHAVLINPHTHWSILLSTIVQALWYAPKFVVTLLATFLVDDVLDELSSEQIALLLLLQSAVVLASDHDLHLDCSVLQVLGNDPQLDAEARQLCWEALGAYEFHQGHFDAAYDLFSHSLAINPRQQRTLMERAMAALSLQRPDDAITDISDAIALKGFLIPLMLNARGKIHQELKNFPEAIADFTQALKLDASQIEVRRNRSQVYLEVGSYPKALEDVNSVLQQGPKDIAALNQRGVIYYYMQRYTDALKDFNDVLTLESRHVPALTNRGVIYSETEHYEEALEPVMDFGRGLRGMLDV